MAPTKWCSVHTVYSVDGSVYVPFHRERDPRIGDILLNRAPYLKVGREGEREGGRKEKREGGRKEKREGGREGGREGQRRENVEWSQTVWGKEN